MKTVITAVKLVAEGESGCFNRLEDGEFYAFQSERRPLLPRV